MANEDEGFKKIDLAEYEQSEVMVAAPRSIAGASYEQRRAYIDKLPRTTRAIVSAAERKSENAALSAIATARMMGDKLIDVEQGDEKVSDELDLLSGEYLLKEKTDNVTLQCIGWAVKIIEIVADNGQVLTLPMILLLDKEIGTATTFGWCALDDLAMLAATLPSPSRAEPWHIVAKLVRSPKSGKFRNAIHWMGKPQPKIGVGEGAPQTPGKEKHGQKKS